MAKLPKPVKALLTSRLWVIESYLKELEKNIEITEKQLKDYIDTQQNSKTEEHLIRSFLGLNSNKESTISSNNLLDDYDI